MRRFSSLISIHVLRAIVPYLVMTWLLLSVVFFVQQAGRFSDLLFGASIPAGLIWKLTIALVPNVIAFTCPIAALVGVIIGLSRIQGDREMVALRAAGVGNLQLSLPILALGILLSLFAFFVNLKGVPFAAQIVRQVALQAALFKLESPVEPGAFNTEINEFTVYVKKGNLRSGTWEKIFIRQDDKKAGRVRLITADSGRIDTGGEGRPPDRSEIHLENATVTTLDESDSGRVVSENVKDLRLAVSTRRGELVERLSRSKESPAEMGLKELADYAGSLEGLERTEAWLLWQRRIILSLTPLVFVLLGTALVSRFNRGGRGFGVFLAVASLIIYYLLTLLGEQLVRTGAVPVLTGGLIPIGASVIAIGWFYLSKRLFISRDFNVFRLIGNLKPPKTFEKRGAKSALIDLTTGILDFDLVSSLIRNYLFTFGFLTIVYLIFTAFELWKFAGIVEGGTFLLVAYLVFLIPFIYIQLSPTALMISLLSTYLVKSRRNEVVSWAASGTSVYRLLTPAFALMLVVGAVNFGFQELVLPAANREQDGLRDRLRSRTPFLKKSTRVWMASGNRIYAFDAPLASDNDQNSVGDFEVYTFDAENRRLEGITKSVEASWKGGSLTLFGGIENYSIGADGHVSASRRDSLSIEEPMDPFKRRFTKPSHLSLLETREKVAASTSEAEKRTYSVSIQKKYSTPFLPFVISLFTAPFALSLSRKGNVLTTGIAVGLWLLFMGVTNVFEQFGVSGILDPGLAVWGPLLIFSVAGLFLITRIRT